MNKHKYNIFPEMNADDYSRLVADLGANGYDQTQPIWIYEGSILDGWNRYKACIDLGIEPVFADFDGRGEDAIEFVMRTNKRRNITSSQWAAIAIKADEIVSAIRKNVEAERRRKQAENAVNRYTKENVACGNKLPEAKKEPEETRLKIAETFNTNKNYISEAQRLKNTSPDKFAKILSGEKTITEIKKEEQTEKRLQERAKIQEAGKRVPQTDRWKIFHGDIQTWQAPRKYDYIITDPPYPKEFLPLWEVLAVKAGEWLVDGGLLIAMSGQSYLPAIYETMSKHLEYYWTACYHTPGQPKPMRQVNVNCCWKPLLIYRKGKYGGKIFGDVFTSDRNDKDLHKWGQSESGMYDIVSKVCLPGQWILDPFCGAGTTGIAAIKNECLFHGLELDENNVDISRGRLHDSFA